MGYYTMFASCAGCKRMISCNPNYVPSLVVNGHREPICESCHARWNEIHRTSKGLEPVSLHPQAYKPQEE